MSVPAATTWLAYRARWGQGSSFDPPQDLQDHNGIASDNRYLCLQILEGSHANTMQATRKIYRHCDGHVASRLLYPLMEIGDFFFMSMCCAVVVCKWSQTAQCTPTKALPKHLRSVCNQKHKTLDSSAMAISFPTSSLRGTLRKKLYIT